MTRSNVKAGSPQRIPCKKAVAPGAISGEMPKRAKLSGARLTKANSSGPRASPSQSDWRNVRAISSGFFAPWSAETSGGIDISVPSTAESGSHITAVPTVTDASVRVEWEDAAGERHHEDRAVAVTYTDEATAAAAEPNGGVLLQMALLDAALAKERAVADSDKGNYVSGSVRLAHSLRLLQGTARMGDPRIDQEVARLQDLVDRMRQGKLDRSARKELRAEIHTARIGTATAARLNLDIGDGPPAV